MDRIVDAALHLPVGMILDARGRIDELTGKGREHVSSQLALARVVGQFAVSLGTKEISKRLSQLIAEVISANRAGHAPATPTPTQSASPPSATKPAKSTKSTKSTRATKATVPAVAKAMPGAKQVKARGASPGAGPRKAPPPRRAVRLPIEGYDTLAASQVIARLDALSLAELEAVRRYESGHRNRKTILGRVTQLTER